MVGIYKITNPKGKVYIGQSINIEERKRKYSKLYKESIGPKLFNSLTKYGWENHEFKLIQECSIEDLNTLETFYKKKILNKFNKDWGKVLFLELHDKSGGPRSKLVKDKIRKSKMGKNTKKIKQYDLEGNLIKEWPSIISAEKVYGKGIKDCLSRKKYTSSNFIWRYEEDNVSINDIERIKNKYSSHKKQVNQLDLEGNHIQTWSSTMEIQNILGYPNSNISRCCLGKQKTAYGFKWKYK